MKSFNIQLFRQYPHIYHISKLLTNLLDSALAATSHKKGLIKIEATFCRNKDFTNDLNVTIIDEIYSMLSSYDNWDYISDWFLVYDYANATNKITVSYENKTQTILNNVNKLISYLNITYNNISNKHCNWDLHDYISRININFNEPQECDEFVEFTKVKISLQKYFVLDSNVIPSVSFKFIIIKTWRGNNMHEAEQSLKETEPIYSFTCEIIIKSQILKLTTNEKLLMFTSLLLKLQDFFDIPTFTKLINNNELYSTIPFFQTI